MDETSKIEPMYTHFSNASELTDALNDLGQDTGGLPMVTRSVVPGWAQAATFRGHSYLDVEPGMNVRRGFDRTDYSNMRPGEAIPTKAKSIIAACDDAYMKVSLIRNVIDLMGDFACEGIRLDHPNKKIQTFYRNWFSKVKGRDRSERFLNLLYRSANVIPYRRTGKITVKEHREMSISTMDANDSPSKPPKQVKKVIPIKYTFLNPLSLDVVGGELAAATDQYIFTLSIPRSIKNLIERSRDDKNAREVLKRLPPEFLKAAKTGENPVLDSDNVFSYYYKKDDWDVWAKPITYSLLDDIILLEKMKLADLSALDSVISNVRIWKLGDIENKFLPKAGAINKLINILSSVSNGQTIDLVWTPDLQFEQHIPDVDKILGSEKYVSVMNSLFQGLGVPPTLTGSANAGGFTNNFISLKTLIERLEYGRSVLMEFWQQEVKYVQKAMGFKLPAKISFDHMSLSDESAEKALWIQLWDRGAIGFETILERFGEDPDIERLRYKREEKERGRGTLPDRASPYHDPDLDKKSELRLNEIEKQGEINTENNIQKDKEKSKVGQPQQGRPKNSRDSTKRKPKKVKPIGASENQLLSHVLWAKDAQDVIDEYINPIFLEQIGKENMRRLTSEEQKVLDNMKFGVLFGMKPGSELSKGNVAKALESQSLVPDEALELYKEQLQNVDPDQKITFDNIKYLRSFVYAAYFNGEN